MNKKVLRGYIIADFTSDDLKNYLVVNYKSGSIEVISAPYNQVSQELLRQESISAGKYDFACIWTRPESILPSINSAMEFRDVHITDVLDEVDNFSRLVKQTAAALKYVFVASWTVPTYFRGWGILELKKDSGIANLVNRANQRLADNLGSTNNIFLLNTQKWIETAGKNAYSPKMWYMAKVPYSTRVLEDSANDILAAINALEGNAKKIIIVDLDNTLWGGIVGDAGWENLVLGGHDHIGEAFVDFQKALRSMKNRGLLLAIVSKNDETTALTAIEKHPEMILKQTDFVAWKINWQDKAKNIDEMVRQLNLGLHSVVFLDDNPHERARVREALPEVFVPDLPEDKMLYRSLLLSLKCFDSPFLTEEDASRTSMYRQETMREDTKEGFTSLDDWLMTLGTKVRIEKMDASNTNRIVQLMNKTNQMNLSTRRMTQVELETWLKDGKRQLLALRVEDKFGDSGLTGILSTELNDNGLQIVDYILSCRVMGRKIEETMIFLALERANANGKDQINFKFVPTAKNKPCFDFFSASGLHFDPFESVFSLNVKNGYPKPEPVDIIYESAQNSIT